MNSIPLSSEKASSFLKKADEYSDLNAFITLNDSLVADAVQSDERISAGLMRPLEGVTIAVKDNISVKGMQLTCASKLLRGFQPIYDATVVELLKDAGALIVGKTNMDEFAMGSSNETSFYGPVKNPHDVTRVSGGSSGGSAVAVAAGMCDVALGSDTGGSIRQPAAFCGVYGFKPTYGRVSRYGLTAFASSLDQIGIFSNSVSSMRDTFRVIARHDKFDSTSHTNAAFDELATTKPLAELRIGRLADSYLEGCAPDIVSAYHMMLDGMAKQGCTIREVSIPNSETWIPTYFILATAEASSNLARFDGVRYGNRVISDEADFITATRSDGFGDEVKRRIMLGTYVLSSGYYDAYYRKAQQARRIISDAYKAMFETVDVFALPTTPTTAFPIGDKTADVVSMWLSDLYTVSANIAGIPAISIPFGKDGKGLPIGLQLQSAMFTDEMLLDVAEMIRP
jgi:aspartyl-tRNA(Asn)/glutamyl-tRNA(Gln) amidotransferase subunit A